MRIFIPAHSFPDSFVDNVQVTLEGMGHDVRTLGAVSHKQYWSLPRLTARVARQMIAGDKPTREERKVIKAAREFKPDLVLSTTGALAPRVLEELGKITSGRRILWWGDAPANNEKWGMLDPGWDVVYLKDRAAVDKLRLVGRDAYLLHEAINPHWHKPVAGQRNGTVVVAGNYYAFRQAIILRLMDDNISFELYGSRPPRWAHPKILAQHTGRYVAREEKSRVFGEGLACLNTFNLSEGDSLNCRAFELAGAGALQLIEYRPAIEECFEPERELIAFKSYDELLGGISRAAKSPHEMKAIRCAGARRALAHHTYEHRLRVILNNL